ASDSAPLRRAAAVVRDRRHVGDAADLEADRIQRAHRRLAARAGALDAHFDVLHAAFLRRASGALRGDLRRERRGFARALEAGVPRGRPGKHVALAVGDRHDGVVERRMHVGDALGDVLLDFLARARLRGLLQFLARGGVPARHLGYLSDWHVQLDGGLARTLPGTRVGAGALAAHGQALAMARAAVALQVDQPLDRHLDLAPQVALDGEPLHALAQPVELGVVQVLDLAVALHAGGGADRLRARAADAVDRGERDLGVLVIGNVDTCYTRHGEPEIIAGLSRS